ncbi:TnsA-like heteromeric transposase endonuclease subunit [Streptomyces europaeiscabiei]|uniref:TnsA-like heteromeric transposase endonuclease subunit n=1 Tax=Streptomyces europaeiscabiei TaxID=146819 RepID=UPI0029A55083|nr:TnsA-like heteromeric transposase endonuclease subunit [Streptomyces europaeiscabiei]MDX3616067.1 TnsA-like heteromeric transposase endonuclease subunit [Streptomyces europaeiscabiei]
MSSLVDAVREVGPVWSHTCSFDELFLPYVVPDEAVGRLGGDPDWLRTWMAVWKAGKADVVVPVRDLADTPASLSVPVRRFSWRAGQRHRPGLEFLVSTGRQHGFESLAERRLLLALDFAGEVAEVLSQPFRLRFARVDGADSHTPDFLALTPGAAWLLDVRPAGRVEKEDEVRFAAAAQAAAAVGWRYAVVTGWHRQVMTVLDTLSARRRPMTDRLGLQNQIVSVLGRQPRQFGDLVEQTQVPAVARAHVVHLLWHRRLAVDLRQPFGDATWVYPVGGC